MPASASTRLNPVTATVGVTATLLARPNPRRSGLTIANSSARTVVVAPHASPSATNGITLGPGGSLLTLIRQEDGELPPAPWYAIALGGAATVSLWEHSED